MVSLTVIAVIVVGIAVRQAVLFVAKSLVAKEPVTAR